MDYALDHGVSFRDAAEIYPVPPRLEQPAANIAGAEVRLSREVLGGIEANHRVYTDPCS